MAYLKVLHGANPGRIVAIPPERAASVGRDPECEVPVDDPTVSARHCRLEPIEGTHVLLDLGSRNGIHVNGQRVERRLLCDRDEIELGDLLLQYRQGAPDSGGGLASTVVRIRGQLGSRDPSGRPFPEPIDPAAASIPTDRALNGLYRLSHLANSDLSQEDLVDRALEEMLSCIAADRLTFHEEPPAAIGVRSTGRRSGEAPAEVPPDVLEAVAHGETVVLSKLEGQRAAGSLAYVPVRSDEVVLGYLCAERGAAAAGEVDSMTARFATAAADVLGVGLQRRRRESYSRALEGDLSERERLAIVGLATAGIAHDVRNLLTSLASFACVAREDPSLLPSLPEEVEKACSAGVELIESMRSATRRVRAQRQAIELREVVKDLTVLLRGEMRSRGIVFELDLDPRPCPIEGSPVDLQSALLNLCLNARRAMPQGGRLRIGVRRHGDRVNVSVADTGIGIPPERMHLLFEPLQTGWGDGHGNGLGLSRARSVVEAHDGEIAVRSEAGSGTRFDLFFPLSE